MKAFFEKVIQQVTGKASPVDHFQPLAGGCINSCYRIDSPSQTYFIKYHQSQYLRMFEQEFNGLQALKEQQVLTIPQAFGYGTCDNHSFLLMEFIASSSRVADFWEQLGRGLAALHQVEHYQYGWDQDNYIGRLPQVNDWEENWRDFFWRHRLQPQIKMAVDEGLLPATSSKDFTVLSGKLESLLPTDKPALLHGDLWSGNVMVGPLGQPCLMDPAVYYGHREIELAFTTLFGGFDERFYESYRGQYGLVPGYESRFEIYNLYPLLVHLNLFGRGYLGGIQHTLKRYV